MDVSSPGRKGKINGGCGVYPATPLYRASGCVQWRSHLPVRVSRVRCSSTRGLLDCKPPPQTAAATDLNYPGRFVGVMRSGHVALVCRFGRTPAKNGRAWLCRCFSVCNSDHAAKHAQSDDRVFKEQRSLLTRSQGVTWITPWAPGLFGRSTAERTCAIFLFRNTLSSRSRLRPGLQVLARTRRVLRIGDFRARDLLGR